MKYLFTKLVLVLQLAVSFQAFSQSRVTATIDAANKTATMSNGIVSITINSKGHITTLTNNNKELLDAANGGRIYFSYNDQTSYKELSPTSIRIQKQTDDYAEVVYSNPTGAIQVEQAFIMTKDASGIYCYVTVKGTATATTLREMRVVYRASPSRFTYGYVSDRMQGYFPTIAEMKAANDTPIMDATYQLSDGTIYTKYDWVNYVQADSVHGMLSPSEGIWAIPVSSEYINGGPMKQEITVHTTNTTPLAMQMLQGEHMGAAAQVYATGDEKMYGPFFIYVNSGNSHAELIEDAKKQAAVQKAQWPFQWLDHSLYPTARTTVTGKLQLHAGLSPKGMQVVLAQPGSDFYNQGKSYIFTALTDAAGNFRINHVRPGTYTLYAYATQGEITDQLAVNNIEVAGAATELGTINWHPAKYENLLWQIGENDRMTSGFKLSDTLRSYGLYNLPPADLNYVVGASKPENDWYYAQTKVGTWTVTFNNDKPTTGNAVLTASIAGATNSPKVDVYVNSTKVASWSFSNDASIYRSAVLGGRHQVKTVTFPASLLVSGQNTVRFTLSNPGNRGGVMYDIIKLESGSLVPGNVTSAGKELGNAKAAGLTAMCYPNPVVDNTTVEVDIAARDYLDIQIFNLKGEKVAGLYEGWVSPGKHQYTWSAGSLPAGIYLYRVRTFNNTVVGKLVKGSN